MELPDEFYFTQTNLQDYVSCPRRFELRYVRRVPWPALDGEPARTRELQALRGQQFHRLAQQYALGIPLDVLSASIADDSLFGWWKHFLDGALDGLPAQRQTEVSLSAPFRGYRFSARYDLIAVEPGVRAVIVDWKTALRRPRREQLAERLQTVLYRFLLVRAGSSLNGGVPLRPEQVSMVYWFAGFPDEPERFAYDAGQFEADGELLYRLAREAGRCSAGDFSLTDTAHECAACTYRSLCGRTTADVFDEGGPDDEPALPFVRPDEVVF